MSARALWAAMAMAMSLSLGASLGAAQTPPVATITSVWTHDTTLPTANEDVGISIDRYIGSADRSPGKISHDGMYVQRILSGGMPDTASAGSVLLPGQETLLATLAPRDVTSLYRFPKALLYYVQSGAGTLDDGRLYWDLHEGSVMLAPPNLAHRFKTKGDAPLKMIMFSYTPGEGWPLRKDILVRDSHEVLMYQRNVHWAHNSKRAFDQSDGTGGVLALVITFAPMSAAGAHVDALNTAPYKTPTQWIHVSSGKMLIQLGSEIRPWPLDTGFVNPANGQTVHNRINLSPTVETMLYLAGPGNPSPPPRPVVALPGRPLGQGSMGQIWKTDEVGGLQGSVVANPEVEASYVSSIVRGRPLPTPERGAAP
jgi:quercetin dioxygenase-like cupin family protein